MRRALTGEIGLYGEDKRESLYAVIAHGRFGQCPLRADLLDRPMIRALALHIWNRAQEY